MGSVVAAPIHSVGERIGRLVEEMVRFSEFSADSKRRQCTRRSNQLSQTLSQELRRSYKNHCNVHVNIGIFRGNRFLRFRNYGLRCKKSRCSWSYFCIYSYNNSLRQSNLKQTYSSDRHNSSENDTSGYNSFLRLNNRNSTCKAHRCNLVRNYICRRNKLAILDSRNQMYTDNMLLERSDSCSKFLSFRSHYHQYNHWRLLQVARTQSGQTIPRI